MRRVHILFAFLAGALLAVVFVGFFFPSGFVERGKGRHNLSPDSSAEILYLDWHRALLSDGGDLYSLVEAHYVGSPFRFSTGDAIDSVLIDEVTGIGLGENGYYIVGSDPDGYFVVLSGALSKFDDYGAMVSYLEDNSLDLPKLTSAKDFVSESIVRNGGSGGRETGQGNGSG